MAYLQTRHVDVGGLLSGTFAELARIPRELAIYLGAVLIAGLVADIDPVAMAVIAPLASIAYFPGQYWLYRTALTRSGVAVDPRFKVFSFTGMALILIWPITFALNLFYIPALLLGAKWVMAPSFLVAEERGLFDAIGDSWSASRDNLLHLSLAFAVLAIGWSILFAFAVSISMNVGVTMFTGEPPESGLGALGWMFMHLWPILLMGLSITAYRSLAEADDSLVAVFE